VLDRVREVWAEQTAEPVATSSAGPRSAPQPPDAPSE
jgi:hypothetical protein